MFTVNLSNAASTATTFALTLADGSAVLADDYTNAMVFSDGVTPVRRQHQRPRRRHQLYGDGANGQRLGQRTG